MLKKRWLVVLGVAVSLAMPHPVQAADAPMRAYRYVALDVYVVGPDLAAKAVGDATGQHVAPLGSVEFTPVGSEATIRVDDQARSSGLVRVSYSQAQGATPRCVPLGTPTVLAGLRPGQPTSVWIWGATMGPWSGCGLGATTGTLTIRG